MNMSEQLLVPGQLEEPFRRELQFYLEQRMVQRLYAKDSSLWSQELINKDPALAKLDWVSLPDKCSRIAGRCQCTKTSYLVRDFPAALDHLLHVFEKALRHFQPQN